MYTALIVGASRGLGYAIAQRLNNNDQFKKIICLSRSRQGKNGKLHFHAVDITNHTSNLYHLRSILGDARINVLINSVGICHQGEFTSLSFDQVISQFNTNTIGVMSIIHALLKMDKFTDPSHIINIASPLGKIPAPTMSVYGASKSALINFSEALGMEIPIPISCVLPTLTETDMTKDLELLNPLIYPVAVEYVAASICDIIFNHSGLKSIGLQATIACAMERVSPFVNRFLLR
jgi:short-subunit dehydrogenase